MPGENFSRRVARAAAVGGGRTYRRQTPLGWYVMLLVICVGGVGLIAYSRYERLHPVASASKSQTNVPPTKANLWQVGLALDICGKTSYLPATAGTTQAFSTDGHGVVTIEPGVAADPALYSGRNATLQAFLLPQSVLLSSTRIEIPGTAPKSATTTTTTTTGSSSTTTTTTTTGSSGSSSSTSSTTAGSATTTTTKAGTSTTTAGSSTTTTSTTTPPKPKVYANGGSCEGKTGKVETMVWDSPSAKTGHLVSNPSTIRFKNGQLITIAFVPQGTSIPKPKSASKIADFLLSNPGGVAPPNVANATTTIPTTIPATVPTTTSSGSTTTTTAAAATSTTTKGSKKKSS